MKVKTRLEFIEEFSQRTGIIDEPDTCPICNVHIKPQILNYSTFKGNNGSIYISIHYLCKACYQPFISLHKAYLPTTYDKRSIFTSELISIEPKKYIPEKFDESIFALSSAFCEIYNQSLQAELLDLDQIAGIGYRKALEFLVKDYAIHENPADTETIKKMQLSQCIKQYIDDHRIKTNAEKSAWIGNDETHYFKKHTDRDIQDMKKFIKATEYFINMVLITEDAETIEPV